MTMKDKVLQSLQDAMKGRKLIRMCHTIEMGLEQTVLPIPQEVWYKYPTLDEDNIRPSIKCHRPFPNRDRDREYTYDSVIWKILADDYLKDCKDELLFFSFKKSTNLSEACDEYGFRELMPDYKLYKEIQDKNLLNEFGVTEEYGLIPSIKKKVEDITYGEIAKELGSKFVVQYSVNPYGFSSSGGRDTFVIENENDYKKAQQLPYKIPARISKFIEGSEVCSSAVSTTKGTIVYGIFAQAIGVPELTKNPSMFCGVDFGQKVPEDTQEEVKRITRHIGDILHKKNFKGIFGVDFMVEEKTNKIYVLEINPRFTAATNMTIFMLHKKNLLPPIALHFCEYLDCFPEGFSIEEYENTVLKSMEGGFLYIRNREGEEVQALSTPKPGIYKLNGNSAPEFVKDSFSIDQVPDKNHILVRHVHPLQRNIGSIETIVIVQTPEQCFSEPDTLTEPYKQVVEYLYSQIEFAPKDTYQSAVPYRTDIPG